MVARSAEIGAGRAQLIRDRRLGLGQKVENARRGLLQASQMAQAPLFPVQILDLRGAQSQCRELFDLKAQQIEPLGPFLSRRLQCTELLIEYAVFAKRRRDRLREIGMSAVGVQKIALRIGPQERLMGVLAVDVDQEVAEVAQLSAGGGSAVDIGARTTVAHDQAAHQTVPVFVEVLLGQPGACAGDRPRSKPATISARSQPARIMAASALSPRARPKASIMIDLPAPVSPVSAVMPDVHSSSSELTMARSLTRMCVNIEKRPTAPQVTMRGIWPPQPSFARRIW
jgi:hypothetical protein